jgi:hypothetical protein
VKRAVVDKATSGNFLLVLFALAAGATLVMWGGDS